MLSEKTNVLNEKIRLEDELNFLAKENDILKESATIEARKSKELIKENKKSSRNYDMLTKDLSEKTQMIENNEKVTASIRKELLDATIHHEKTVNDLELSHTKNNILEQQLQKCKEDDNVIQLQKIEIQKIKEEKLSIDNSFQNLQSLHNELTLKSHEMEEQLIKINNEELFNLKLQLKETQAKAQDLKEQLVYAEDQQNFLLDEKNQLQELLQKEQVAKEKLEVECCEITSQKDGVERSLETLKIEKDSLFNDLSSSKQEIYRIKSHCDNIYTENRVLAENAKDLSKQVAELKRQLKDAEENFAITMSDVRNRNFDTIEQFHVQLDDLEKSKLNIESEKEELIRKLSKVTNQHKNSQSILEEETLKNQANVLKLENEVEELKASHQKSLLRAKRELEDSEESCARELDDTIRNYEKKHKSEIVRLSKEKMGQIENLRREIDELNNELTRQQNIHCEEILNAENSNQQALLLVEQKLNLVIGQNTDLSHQLEEATRENENLKGRTSTKGETDRNYITDLQLKNSRMEHQIEQLNERFKFEKRKMTDAFTVEKAQREEAEQQISKLKANANEIDEKLILISEELEESKLKLREAEMERKSKIDIQLEAVETRLVEAQATIENLEQGRKKLTEQNHLQELDKLERQNDIDAMAKKLQGLEIELSAKEKELTEKIEDYSELQEKNYNFESLISNQKNDILVLKTDYQKLVEEHNDMVSSYAMKSSNDKNKDSSQISKLNIKISEYEGIQQSLEQELALITATNSNQQTKLEKEIEILQQEIDNNKLKEQKKERQNHEIEILLNESREDVQKLLGQIKQADTRIGELQRNISKKEIDITQRELKLTSIANIIHQIRSSPPFSRAATPTRRTYELSTGHISAHNRERRSISGESRESSSENPSNKTLNLKGACLDHEGVVDNVKLFTREFMTKLVLKDKENEELHQRVAELKSQNDEHLTNTFNLEEQLSRVKLRFKGSEEQERNLEKKLSNGDVTLAIQDENIRRLELEIRQLSRKLIDISRQLEEAENVSRSSEDALEKSKEHNSALEMQNNKLKKSCEDYNSKNSRFETQLKSSEGEQKRLELILSEKENQIKNTKMKCEELASNINSLEIKCLELSSTVDLLNTQLDKAKALEILNQSESVAPYSRYENQSHTDEFSHLKKMLETCREEKNFVEKKLETWKSKVDELKEAKEKGDERICKLEHDLQKSESKANAISVKLESTRAALESNDPDDNIRKELTRILKDNDSLQLKLQEAIKTISKLEHDRSELERQIQKQKSKISTTTARMMDQVDHVRTQIPLVASEIGIERTRVQGSNHLHHHNLLKIKIAEQETERQRKKVNALREQLASLEKAQDDRIQGLLSERRKEKEKELRRHKVELDRCRESLNAKERIYRERIKGLEDQMELLKDQLGKELRRKEDFISNSTGITQEISRLRDNLDESLQNVSVGAVQYLTSEELGKTLDRESSKLYELGQNFTKTTNSSSKISNSGSPSNHDTLDYRYFKKAKRTLSFENIMP